jgi:hypothetical protein
LQRTNNATAGTAGSTISTVNMPKKDSASIDSLMTGGLNYSVEPTTFDANPLYDAALNDRNGLVKEWDELAAPVVNQNQTMCLRAAPTEAVASIVSGTIEFELF